MLVEKGADKLEELARKLAAHGGLGQTVAEDLVIDADFIRKMKPSLILARARGDAPKNGQPSEAATVVTPPPAPKAKKKGGGGPNPLLVVGGALVAGIVLAKLIDWRGHAHPRD
jgi:hypothetical protein